MAQPSFIVKIAEFNIPDRAVISIDELSDLSDVLLGLALWD